MRVMKEDDWKPPNAYHRYCIRHFASNLNQKVKCIAHRDLLKDIAKENHQIKFRNHFKNFKELLKDKPDAVKWLEKVNPEYWSLAYDIGGRRWGSMTTNQSESFNHVLMPCRDLPITALVHFTFKQVNSYFIERRDLMVGHNKYFVPKIETLNNTNLVKAGYNEVQMYDQSKGIASVLTKSKSRAHEVSLEVSNSPQSRKESSSVRYVVLPVIVMPRRTRDQSMHDMSSPSSSLGVEDTLLPDVLHVLEPGPIDKTLLYKQDTHRSNRIWETSDIDLLTVRHRGVNWEADEHILAHLIRVGFGPWYYMHNYEVDWSFMIALVERWRSETHTFHLHNGEMTITLEDVGVLTGLPIEGRAVTVDHEVDDYAPLYKQLLGVVSVRGKRDTTVRRTWFRDHMQTLPAEPTELDIQIYEGIHSPYVGVIAYARFVGQ
ncbi:hypothetical protein QQ045_006255 [Rhodiola kirilowii]